MKTIGIFDVIGPNMIGPSSSHTAGALRISLFARQQWAGNIKKVEFMLYGSFAETYRGHGTDRALIGGILGFNVEDTRIRNAFEHAHNAGIEYVFLRDREKMDVHPNTVDITITDSNGHVNTVTGVSIGGSDAKIININGTDVEIYC